MKEKSKKFFPASHREKLKKEGKIHLPPNKVETPATVYSRLKGRKMIKDLKKLNYEE